MARTIRMTVAYDGTGFRGWAAQRDPAIRTVAGALGDHLERVLGERPRLVVAGRTDAGVHARGNVASFVTESALAPERLARALNAALAPEVVVRDAAEVPATFSARFSATAREYVYRIDTSPVPDPFTARFVWHRPGDLHVAVDARGGPGPARGARLRLVLPSSGRRPFDGAAPRSGDRPA